LTFTRVHKYYEDSREGYRVVANGCGENKYKFVAWCLKPSELISAHDDSQDARDACAEHYKEHNK